MTRFLIYDVFTDSPFTGNPLAIVPDATALPDGDLQRIAREFNFSETTFVYPPEDPAHTARVRIFTPTRELPFAGHPVIGTAVTLAELGTEGDLTFELGVGPMPVSIHGNKAEFRTSYPLVLGLAPNAETVSACLGLVEHDVRTDRHAPRIAGVGIDFTLCELKERSALERALPLTDAFHTAAARYPTKLDFAVLAYVREAATIRARMFAPLDNIPEDPATGSAAAALTAFLSDLEQTAHSFTIHQGVEMGRASLIETRAEMADGQVTAVHVAGRAVRFAAGELAMG